MRTVTLSAAVFLAAFTPPPLQAAPPSGQAWTLDPVRSDEFDDLALDTSRWVSGPLWYASTGEAWPFRAENGFVSARNLHLRAVPGTPLTVAAVHSKFLIPGESYLEVRAKCLPWAARILTAIWLQGPFESQHNPNVEIDVQEVFDPRRIESNLHLWEAAPDKHVGGGVGHPVDVGVDVTEDYHLYGLERRSPDVVRVYFDGQIVWDAKPSDPARYVSQERWLIFSLEGHLQGRGMPVGTAHLPADALIDYVRLYRLGAAQK
jgi:hypothetical protein